MWTVILISDWLLLQVYTRYLCINILMYCYIYTLMYLYTDVLYWYIDVLTYWSLCASGSLVPLQQAQLQAAAARSGLQEALQRLQRLRQQLQDSSSVVENTNNTVKQTNQLVTHTQTAGRSATFINTKIQKLEFLWRGNTSCFLFDQPIRRSVNWRRRSIVQSVWWTG